MLNKNMDRYLTLDVIKFLDDHNVDYKESGKNVGRNWIGVQECIFCGAGGYHLGINRQSKGISCFVCGTSGIFSTFVELYLKISKQEAYHLINKYLDDKIDVFIRERSERVLLPSNMNKKLCSRALMYLNQRNFNPQYIQDKYKIECTTSFSQIKINDQKSDFKYRIIIPIYMNRKLVSFTARDYTNEQETKYKNPVLEACVIPPSSSIYNIDTINDRCIIVEGPTDVWRLGDEAISLQGVKFTKEQIRFLAEKDLKKVVILFDIGAEENALKLSNALSGIIKDIRIATLANGDPADLDPIKVPKIKYDLLYA